GTPAGVRKIGESPRRVVGSHAYFARAGIPHLPQDLARHQVVVHDRRAGGAVWTFRRHDTVLAVETSGRLRVREAEGVRAAALAGLGLAIGSDWLFADALRDGRLAAALEGWTLPPAELWAAFPAGRPATSRARAFVAFVEAMLGVAAAQRDLA
ncbi:LysR substrate-binding domain-containing protein, partial [Burkholderia glumae]